MAVAAHPSCLPARDRRDTHARSRPSRGAHRAAPAPAPAAILGAFARTFGLGEIWLPVPEPQPVTSDKLLRAVRYLALNPCRPWSGNPPLVSDPLAWPWSTHRDVVGAIADPWVNAPDLARALRWDHADFVAGFHRYVSSDPHVSVDGTPLPKIAAASQLPAHARQAGDLCADDWLRAGAMSLALGCSTSSSQKASVRRPTKDVPR